MVEGSTLGKAWQAGRLQVPTLAEYVQAATAMIQHTPPEVIYHRVSAPARRPTLLAPEWCENRWSAMVEIAKALELPVARAQLSALPMLVPKRYRPLNGVASRRGWLSWHPSFHSRFAKCSVL